MDRFGPVVLAMTGGGLIAAQAPINARLKLVVGSPLLAAAVSFAVGTLLLVVAVLMTNAQGGVTALGGGPWWAYLGGFCGAVLVTATLIASPAPGRYLDVRGGDRRSGGGRRGHRPVRALRGRRPRAHPDPRGSDHPACAQPGPAC